MLHRTFLQTPVGPLLAVASPDGLCGLEFDRPERAVRLWSRLRRWRPADEVADGDAPAFGAAAGWLDAYFAKRWQSLPPVRLDLQGTAFELAVWQALRDLRPGETSTYGAIAKRLRRRDAARAVGAAVGANPVSLIVPCHRVVGTSGSLTGYGGGLDRKEWLLQHEGALLL
jgi:methylated-DNA-[protein]-cysteine S-methyltransferase